MDRSGSRSRSRSASSERSYSSDDEVAAEGRRKEREEREAERKEERAYRRRQRREAKKRARLEEEASAVADSLYWTFDIPGPENEEDEDKHSVQLRAKKRQGSTAVDCCSWDALELYLRREFHVHESIKKVCIKCAVMINERAILHFKVTDQNTLCSGWSRIIDLGQILLDGSARVSCTVASMSIGQKLKVKSQPRTPKQIANEQTFKDLKRAIYSIEATAAGPSAPAAIERLQYSQQGDQTGIWTAAASDIMRKERGFLIKFHSTRSLCMAVMGNADYHPSPCILICPFGTCSKAHRHLNSFSAVSQLYSHWKNKHRENPAAALLANRWRLANELTDNGKRLLPNLAERLDQSVPLILNTEEMEHLGGPNEGYEAIRAPTLTSADFKHRAVIDSADHQTWLQAAGTI